MFRLAFSICCCSLSVHSFVPQLPITNPFQTTTSSSEVSRRFLSIAAPRANRSVVETVGEELLPEYQHALDKTITKVSAVLKDTKPEVLSSVIHFCTEYLTASQNSYLKHNDENANAEASMERILQGVQFAYKHGMSSNTYKFGVTHEALRGIDPESEEGNVIDFYAWGCDFFRYFMDMDESKVLGFDNLKKAMGQADAGDNVVFLSNHQSEADPQVMSVMLEKAGYGKEAENVIYVAGHKVTTDPLAIPFSMGRNLICIHSKKHIDADPDTKSYKNRQNLKAMGGMLKKLQQGGCLLWVAPSGGRDRRDVESGQTPVAPFDKKTIDMFRLMGRKSKVSTHYYTLAMVSYELCPPPDFVEAGIGEQRNFRFVPVGIKVGEEISSENEFHPGAYKQTKKDYNLVLETIFPGTASET